MDTPTWPAWIDRRILSFDSFVRARELGARAHHFFNPTLLTYQGRTMGVCRSVDAPQEQRFAWFGAKDRGTEAAGSRDLLSFVLDDDYTVRPTNTLLSAQLRSRNNTIAWHADPRLFTLRGRPFLTFNTGHSERPNRICVVELDDTGAPVSDILIAEREGHRGEVEKNWGFFDHDGRLYCVYSVHPLVIMSCEITKHRVVCTTAFEHHFPAGAYEGRFGVLHGGACPVRIGNSWYYAVHSKHPSDKERVYVGNILAFDANPPFKPQSLAHEPIFRLTADEEAAQPPRRLNPKLKSSFYPSGLAVNASDGTVIAAYGINDFKCGVRRYRTTALLSASAPVPSIEHLHFSNSVPRLRTYYWSASQERPERRGFRFGNVGDQLQELVVCSLFQAAPECDTARGSRLLAVGSIAHRVLPGDIIWGSGFKEEPTRLTPTERATVDVRAVRGPLTLDYLRRQGIDVRGVQHFFDPALLLTSMLAERISALRTGDRRRTPVLFIPHYKDYKAFISTYASRGHEVATVNASVLDFCASILNADLVVSSSLHGIIFAEALGIPALMHEPSGEPLQKYHDYYLGTDRRVFPVVRHYRDITRRSPPPLPRIDTEMWLSSRPQQSELMDRGVLRH
jgi:hypothetical protein